VEREGAGLRAQLLQVPHHGSRTSSTSAFLDAVAPHTAIVQAGYRNRYGHPTRDVLARYEARGIVVERSDRCGAFSWRPGGEGRCLRRDERRYWHHRP
jgi:competence protein ComEC